MNKEFRISKITEIRNSEPLGEQEIMWQDQLESMPVFKVPLEHLVYNKYNGRILSRTKSLESQDKSIDSESVEGKRILEKFLWESRIDRNERTKGDIEKYGQKIVGIITKDGIIIDGNRRAMLLNKIDKFDYFKAIILPVTLEENPIEIEKLETSYQMGEDEKLGYNPIEKYLKTKNLKQKDVSVKQIANWMGESVSTVNEYLDVMDTMDDYLNYLEYDGIFTQLDNREDQFINLTKWVKVFYGGGSVRAFDGYTDADVDELKSIAFDYIRAKYEGKKFRYLGHGQKQNHFFGNENIWESFKKNHSDSIPPIYSDEEKINKDSENLTATLNGRDNEFKIKAQPFLDKNIEEHLQKIYNQKNKEEPDKLISKAIDSINVAKGNKNIGRSDVLKKVKQLNKITANILQGESPQRLLEQILNLLSSITVLNHLDEKDKLLKYTKDIEKEAYRLEKDIKKLK